MRPLAVESDPDSTMKRFRLDSFLLALLVGLCLAPAAAQEQFETLDPGPLPAHLPAKPAPFDWRRDLPPPDQAARTAQRSPGHSTPRLPGAARLHQSSLPPLFAPPPGEQAMRQAYAERLAAQRRHSGGSKQRGKASIQSLQSAAPEKEYLQVKATPVYFRNWRLAAGHEYRIETRNLSADGDTLLYVLRDGRQIAMNNDRSADDRSSLVRFTPEVSGDYTLLIRALDDAHAGLCDLFIDGQVRQQEIAFGGAVVPWSWQAGDRFQTAHLPSTYARSVDTVLFAFDGLNLVGWNDNGGIAGCSALTLQGSSESEASHVLVASASPDPADADWATLCRNALSQGDADGDGLADPLEASLGTDPQRIDTDGDGLRDDWELLGVHTPMGDEDLPAYAGTGLQKLNGSDPRVPDLFLEIDWMSGPKSHPHLYRPLDAAIDRVTERFWNSGGIALHVDLGQMGTNSVRGGQLLPYQESFDRTGTEPLSLERCYDSSEWFAPSRRHLFAYMVCVSHFPDRNSSGHMVRFNEDGSINEISLFNTTLNPAAIVCMGTAINGSPQMEAGTIMHEFGHCLNLQHGGFESFNNFKPNYTSSMNYLFQFGGLDADGDPDYSHGMSPVLDERRLDERVGVGPVSDRVESLILRGRNQPAIFRREDVRCQQFPTAIDWDGDGQISETPVRVDFNADGWYGPLRDFDDWSEVRCSDRGMLWIGVNAGVEKYQSTAGSP
jgi:hypothetical protein